MEWKLGPYHSARKYQDYREYSQRACLPAGKYILTCTNSDKPEGWKKGLLQFQGVAFCNDFMSFKVFRHVIVGGKKHHFQQQLTFHSKK